MFKVLNTFVIFVLVRNIYSKSINKESRVVNKVKSKSKPNILMMLADDLGIGDTSVPPFTGTGILTPNLEKMAKSGTIMTNFHAAAPICSPSRAAILTGMYPWRFSIAGVYDYGIVGKSNRNDWLPQVPTTAMAFRDAGYYTAHSGKWHLGGMRNYDLEMRRAHGKDEKKICPHPGPNQMGFEEYVTMEEGPDSPRQTTLQRSSTLHSQGGKHMYRNDVMEGGGCPSNISSILSDCEAYHAIRVMEQSVARGQPFFLQLWFYAPHGPWETIPKYKPMYPKLMARKPCQSWGGEPGRNCRLEEYMTMVSALDGSIGTVLEALRRLNIENNTLVIFTSDNGPEDESGTTAGFKGRKRFLQEGGLRVPTIWQWPGVIPAGAVSKTFGTHTDLFPTFLDASGVAPPPHAMLDGISLLPILRGEKKRGAALIPVSSEKTPKDMFFQAGNVRYSDRIAMWYKDYEGPRMTAGWIADYKLHLDSSYKAQSFFDMVADPFEDRNLLNSFGGLHCNYTVKFSAKHFGDRSLRADACLQKWILDHFLPILQDFGKYGADAHKLYLQQNPERNMLLTNGNTELQILNKKKLCSPVQACDCSTPSGKSIHTLPFKDLPKETKHVLPKPRNASLVLEIPMRLMTSSSI